MRNLLFAFLLFATPCFAGPHGSFSPSTVADVAAFSATSGATGKLNLARFEEPIRQWGLWPNMVCWPLISSQNAGTGTTVYSFGGLGSYPGTLVNGPTWGATGLTTASTQYVDFGSLFNFQVTPGKLTVLAIEKTTVTSFFLSNFKSSDNGGYEFFCNSTTAFAVLAGSGTENDLPISKNTTDGAFHSFLQVFDGANHLFRVDSTETSLTACAGMPPSNSTQTLKLGRRSDGSAQGPGTCSFVMVSSTFFSTANRAAVTYLYKSTLGQGLGIQ